MDEPLTLEQQALVAANIRLPHWFAGKMTRNCPHLLEDASDVAVDALIQSARTFDPERDLTFSTLACACMRNAFWAMLRAKIRRLSLRAVSLDEMTEAEPQWSDRLPDESPDFETLISSLSAREVLVLMMRYRDDMKLREIGESLDLSRERVRQIQAGALAKLREILDQAA